MTSAESTIQSQPIAEESTPRTAFVRDLYALAEWYVAHPDYPLPQGMHLYAHASAAVVLDVADEYGRPPYGDHPQTHHYLPGTSVPITMCVSVEREARPL